VLIHDRRSFGLLCSWYKTKVAGDKKVQDFNVCMLHCGLQQLLLASWFKLGVGFGKANGYVAERTSTIVDFGRLFTRGDSSENEEDPTRGFIMFDGEHYIDALALRGIAGPFWQSFRGSLEEEEVS